MGTNASGPLVIGLAGSIAAGKSTVGAILVELGALHTDGDRLVHRLYDPNTPGFDRVVEAFGTDIIGADGYIDRKVLGQKVFGKPEEMAKLTKAIGSITDAFEQQIASWRKELGPEDIAVIEAVNLMEPGYARWCDQTWLIGVSDDVARTRLRENRAMSDEEATSRLSSQRPVERRRGGADWVYINDGSTEDLRTAVVAELERIRAIHRVGQALESVFPAWWDQLVDDRKALELEREAGVRLARAEQAAPKDGNAAGE
jgi:dephospho-CoA kinase